MSRTSSVCVGLQSCLEPRGFMNKIDSSKPSICQDGVCDSKECVNGDLGGWSFLPALVSPSQPKNVIAAAAVEEEVVYVHPLVKRSASTLSSKSLEMCTESLGSETGSDISESIDDFPSLSPEKESFPAFPPETPRYYKYRETFPKKLNRTAGSFPPPLTSISGCDGVQVRPHREGGRLIITAVAVTLCSSFFLAERSDGRLRLSLRKPENEIHENEDAEEEEDNYNEEEEKEEEGEESPGGGENSATAGDEVAPIARPTSRRCKESESRSKEMQSWGGPYCVAIS